SWQLMTYAPSNAVCFGLTSQKIERICCAGSVNCDVGERPVTFTSLPFGPRLWNLQSGLAIFGSLKLPLKNTPASIRVRSSGGTIAGGKRSRVRGQAPV